MIFVLVVLVTLIGVLGSLAGCTAHYLIFGDAVGAHKYIFPCSLTGYLVGYGLGSLLVYVSWVMV